MGSGKIIPAAGVCLAISVSEETGGRRDDRVVRP
jgi:hypothetical protein